MSPAWFHKLTHREKHQKRTPRPGLGRRREDRLRRPRVESLEDRVLLAASLSIPTDLSGVTAGTVVVPVNVNQLDDGNGATGLAKADLDIAFDPTAFSVAPSDVS